ncbi:hypothetical protein GCM10023310_55400 [Paenibacillus vulneris]|uniref:Tyrosine protein kinase n=1 Tax=Paenibacillus vulneris TaxID=1133364 RepID=A0ABW3UVA6_9BACL|nr:hypothetical protein [Paenibacillus sp. 32352]
MTYQRPTIGNQGDPMRSFTQPGSFFEGGQYPVQYPGMEINSYAQSPVPATNNGGGGGLTTLLGGSGGGGNSNINIGQIKQIIDRLGGIEGIVDTVSKVQRMVQSVQQVAPLVKVLMGGLLKKKNGDSLEVTPRRKRRRKRKTGPVQKTRVKRRTSR